MKASSAERIQAALHQENLDGWLLQSFHGSQSKSEMLDALPGEKKVYLSWRQLHSHLAEILKTHLRAACHMRKIVDVTFGEVARRIFGKIPITKLHVNPNLSL